MSYRTILPIILALLITLQTAVAQDAATVTRNFKNLGLSVLLKKGVDSSTGETRIIATSLDGSPVDLAGLEAAEARLAASASRIDPALQQRLSQDPSARQTCTVWLRFDPDSLEFRSEMGRHIAQGMDEASARKMMQEQVARVNSETINPGISLLESLGLEVIYADSHAPVIVFNGTYHQIAGLALSDLVDRVYLSLDYEAELNNAVATHRFDRVHDFGVRGDGVKVAIVESTGVSNTHPDLNVTAWFNSANPNVGFHPTAIAGIIGSSNAANPGHARGVEILSGNSNGWSDAQLMAATSWAITQGADIINMSFGSDTNLALASLDRYVDYTIRNTATCIVKSAGNRGNTDGDCTSPGLGWNILTTGNVADGNNANWVDDAMAFDSSFGNPISANGDRTKPDLCAVGSSMVTSNTAGGFSNQGSGTSYAAPGIVGMAAALMQARSSLKYWPEEVRALMMTASGHNIEGSSRLSDNDGAGCINGLRAYRIVEQGNLTHGTLSPTSFSNNGYKTQDIYLRAGDMTRIVLCWDSKAASDYTTNVLDADLDLAVLFGQSTTAGPILASSGSWDNSYEIIEFCPTTTGWHTIRINDFRFDGTSEYYGLAWSQDGDGRYTRFRPYLPETATGDTCGPVIGNPHFWLDPIDAVNPNATYLCLPSLGLNTGIQLGNCQLIYGDWDALTNYAFGPSNSVFLNMIGSLDGNGTTYSPNIAMPDHPFLVGFDLVMNMLTIVPSNGIKEISRPEKIEFESKSADLSLSDDGSAAVALPFSFPFYGTNYTEVYVNANGNLTFGGSSIDWSQSVAEMETGLPRIAPLWTDLNPMNGGEVRVRRAINHIVVEWNNVEEFGSSTGNPNSVLVYLYSDGHIEFKYRDCSASTALVGITPGNSTGTMREVNVNHGFVTSYSGGGICEVFDTTSLLDLSISSSYRNTVRFTPVGSTYRLTVDLQ